MVLYTLVLVSLLVRDMGHTSQGHLPVDGGMKLDRSPTVVPTRPYEEGIGRRLLDERSRADRQTSGGLYVHHHCRARCGEGECKPPMRVTILVLIRQYLRFPTLVI